ncbi:YhgE/Pip domain-containing protein [Latilactobacillus sakei]|uniref:YhgE/Pip domain-containing protein n=1 Tax=Latilactobacillus sakei TaxID=1599 RepID=UPI00077C9B1B|nr:YhgE/Pip domain-containing protein [Latilactobacillus sakei]AWZ44476.1 YhgE/Pip domain-containing protein [Latilactobacillus sakei]MDM5043942.1 YhgE/Pip domain-containing protein [Latilactobacillus sakei]QMU85528.1 YhgE/Pip domain-containing protein [Latilactobacillus sakei]UNC19284.1 YhgE/Pip domain-containing protein [Latilactobacillus sakei]
MKKTFELFHLDWRRILKSPIAFLLILALIIIPSLYAWFNIWALWDPYSKTQDLKVAVYSADQSVTVAKKKVAIGDELIDQLKKNDKLGWQFTSSKKQLDEGVKTGKYYAGIYVPKNFSKDLISFVDGKIQKPTIIYSSNDKINAIAPKITSAGATTLQSTISEEFVQTVAKTLMSSLNKAGFKLDENLPVINRFSSMILKTDQQIPEINQYTDQVVALQKKIPEMQAKLTQANDFVNFLPEANKMAKKVVGVNQYLPEVESAGALAVKVQGKIPEIQSAGKQVATLDSDFDGIANTLTNGISEAKTGLTVLNKTQTVLPEIITFGKSAQQVSSQVKNDLIPKLKTTLPVIQSAVDQGLTITDQLAKNIDNDLNAVNKLLEQAKNDPDNQELKAALKTNLEQLSAHTATLQANNTQLANTLQSLQDAYNESAVAAGKPGSHLLDDPIQKLNAAATHLGQLKTKIDNVLAHYDDLSLTDIQNQLTPIIAFAKQVQNTVSQVQNAGIGANVKSVLAKFETMITQGDAVLNQINTAVLPKLPSLLTNTQKTLKTAIDYLEKYQKQIPALKQEIHDANTLLNDNMGTIVSGLNTASDLYQNDYPTLKNKLQLATGFINNDLPGIENDLTTTLAMANAKFPLLEKALNDATDLIHNDWPFLRSGIQKGAEAIRKQQKTVDLKDLIKLLRRDATKESNFLAEPVKLQEKHIYPIKTYGSASAPFYTALCLWVGALLLSNIVLTNFSLDDKQKERYSKKQQFIARWLTYIVIGVAQAVFVALGNIFLIKAYIVSPVALLLLAVFLSMVFMTIVYVLAAMFGNVGKGLAMIILVLSISGGGGNFPVVLSDKFFQFINPLLPFTYGVNLLREPTGGIYVPNLWHNFIILAIYAVVFFFIGLFLKDRINPFFEKLHKEAAKSKIIH